ncbi:MAG: ribonuclease HI [Gammaproteobacteria bacterium]|nr:ribonuclease HI [Gammaproteobacteria bacterium]NNM20069.1 ribonuclease HI [Gammaproteobacteria bacterium]
MKEVVIHTDGACRGNPGPGAWAAILSARGSEKELSGAEELTTNNRMEMMAAIRALEALKRPASVTIYTDSVYLLRGVTEWMHGWKRRGWKTSSRKPVKNRELWERLDELVGAHDIEWVWVKGHSGDPGNERADELANVALDRMLQADG